MYLTYSAYGKSLAERIAMTIGSTADRLEVGTRHLFDVVAHLEPAQVIPSPAGMRRTFVVVGGTVEGSRIRARILPGGGDWVRVGADGILRLDVRNTYETDDGALIHVAYHGIIDATSETLGRLAQGETLGADELYFRTAPLYETGAERYSFLNRLQAIAVGALAPNEVRYQVFEVL
jgi:hypothetical protein